MNTKVFSLGDSNVPEAIALKNRLAGSGFDLVPASLSDSFDIVLLFCTASGFSKSDWHPLDKNRNARVIPILFEGGTVPALFCDIKPANFVANPDAAFNALLQSLHRFC